MPSKKAKIAEAVDTEQYVIEKIAKNKVVNNTIHYTIKWEGYTKEYDSDETEWRMTCDEKLTEFAVSRLDPKTYIDKINPMLGDLRNFAKDSKRLRDFIDPISILAQTTVQCGSVKFVDFDTITSKLWLLEHIRDSNQEYLLHSALIPSDDEIDRSEMRYGKELKARLDLFIEHPLVKVIIPQEIETVFYSPPPLSNLIFEPVTQEMSEQIQQYTDIFVPKSSDKGFNRVTPFLTPEYFRKKAPKEDPLYYESYPDNDKEKLYEGMKRDRRRIDPRFLCNLELQTEIGRGWVLKASHDILKETPIILMSGVICSSQTAHDSLISSGERIAFSSFIEIPGTGMCLDRRNYHDFTKYIPHSCAPTCSVRLVVSGNDIPDMVVYSTTDINADNDFIISIDYYQGFKKEVSRFFWNNKHPDGKIFSLYEKNIDFVHCQCLMERKCRTVLYIDRSLKCEDPTASKTTKLQNLDPKFVFRGMSVADRSNKLWQIREGIFVE